MGTGLIENLQCNYLFILAMFLGAGYQELVGGLCLLEMEKY